VTDMVIVGAGVTGLAAGMSSGAPVYEQSDGPGGICRSYYMRPGDSSRFDHAPAEDDAYRFEVGGGHWIFGGDADVMTLLGQLAPLGRYERRAAVRLAEVDTTIPYPLQDHVERLPVALSQQIARERNATPAGQVEPATLRAWLERAFGPTLCEVFFFPFHERYTAGQYKFVAPEDSYKSPAVPVASRVPAGKREGAGRVGYNAEFCYPEGGSTHWWARWRRDATCATDGNWSGSTAGAERCNSPTVPSGITRPSSRPCRWTGWSSWPGSR